MPEITTNWLQNELPSIAAQFQTNILKVDSFRSDRTLWVQPEALREIISSLKQEASYTVLMDLFGVDYLKLSTPMPTRFAVVYNLYSVLTHGRIFLKAFVGDESPQIDSIWDLYKAANWFEREAWDLYGITFVGHPHLTRILCHNDFEGHPLRKDYPADQYQRLKTTIPSSGL